MVRLDSSRNRQIDLSLKEVQKTLGFSLIGEQVGADRGQIMEVMVNKIGLSLQNLDPFYLMDLGFWDGFGREIPSYSRISVTLLHTIFLQL